MIIFFKMLSRSGLTVYSHLSIGMITSEQVAELESMKLETAVGDPKALETGHDGYKDLAKGLVGYWYQTGTVSPILQLKARRRFLRGGPCTEQEGENHARKREISHQPSFKT